MNILVGIAVLMLPGGVFVYGSLTGRLAAMIAALVKPQDLGSPGSTVNGTPDIGTNAASGAGQNQSLLHTLLVEANRLGVSIKPVQPLITTAFTTGKDSDYQKAITALRKLLAPHIKAGTPGKPLGAPGRGPISTQGGSSDPTAGRPPIIAPPTAGTPVAPPAPIGAPLR